VGDTPPIGPHFSLPLTNFFLPSPWLDHAYRDLTTALLARRVDHVARRVEEPLRRVLQGGDETREVYVLCI
jgi:hypothetical protein